MKEIVLIEVMDLKLERRVQSHQMKSYEKLPSLSLNYTAERLEGESLGEQLGELGGEEIVTKTFCTVLT